MQSATSFISTKRSRSIIRLLTVWAVLALLMLCGCLQFHHHDDSGHLCIHIADSMADHHSDNNDIGSEPDGCSLHLPSVTNQKRADCNLSVSHHDASFSDFIAFSAYSPIILCAVDELHTIPDPVISDKVLRYISFRAPPYV